jgi:hypothetical protein
MGQRWLDGYSAAVEIYLIVDGTRHDVAQIGDGSLILREEVDIEPDTDAKLVMIIDGHEEMETVVLPKGASRSDKVVPFF